MTIIEWEDFFEAGTTIKFSITEDTPIYIWGISPEYNHLLNMLSTRHNNIVVFDNPNGNTKTPIGNYPIQFFSVESVENVSREEAVFALAFKEDQLIQEAAQILNKLGFQYVYNANLFKIIYQSKKVFADYQSYQELNDDHHFEVLKDNSMLIISDWMEDAGAALNDSYLIQDLWGAKKVFENHPLKHFDIGSCVSGFIMHLLSFGMPVTLIDIRPLETYNTENLTFINEDATKLTSIADNSIESLSALCSLEHFGLGRYGDPVDPSAHLKAFENIQRVIKPGGHVYISLPVYKKCFLQFNAHRIYSPNYVIEHFHAMELKEFSLCTGKGIYKNAPIDLNDQSEPVVGLFHFQKA